MNIEHEAKKYLIKVAGLNDLNLPGVPDTSGLKVNPSTFKSTPKAAIEAAKFKALKSRYKNVTGTAPVSDQQVRQWLKSREKKYEAVRNNVYGAQDRWNNKDYNQLLNSQNIFNDKVEARLPGQTNEERMARLRGIQKRVKEKTTDSESLKGFWEGYKAETGPAALSAVMPLYQRYYMMTHGGQLSQQMLRNKRIADAYMRNSGWAGYVGRGLGHLGNSALQAAELLTVARAGAGALAGAAGKTGLRAGAGALGGAVKGTWKAVARPAKWGFKNLVVIPAAADATTDLYYAPKQLSLKRKLEKGEISAEQYKQQFQALKDQRDLASGIVNTAMYAVSPMRGLFGSAAKSAVLPLIGNVGGGGLLTLGMHKLTPKQKVVFTPKQYIINPQARKYLAEQQLTPETIAKINTGIQAEDSYFGAIGKSLRDNFNNSLIGMGVNALLPKVTSKNVYNALPQSITQKSSDPHNLMAWQQLELAQYTLDKLKGVPEALKNGQKVKPQLVQEYISAKVIKDRYNKSGLKFNSEAQNMVDGVAYGTARTGLHHLRENPAVAENIALQQAKKYRALIDQWQKAKSPELKQQIMSQIIAMQNKKTQIPLLGDKTDLVKNIYLSGMPVSQYLNMVDNGTLAMFGKSKQDMQDMQNKKMQLRVQASQLHQTLQDIDQAIQNPDFPQEERAKLLKLRQQVVQESKRITTQYTQLNPKIFNTQQDALKFRKQYAEAAKNNPVTDLNDPAAVISNDVISGVSEVQMASQKQDLLNYISNSNDAVVMTDRLLNLMQQSKGLEGDLGDTKEVEDLYFQKMNQLFEQNKDPIALGNAMLKLKSRMGGYGNDPRFAELEEKLKSHVYQQIKKDPSKINKAMQLYLNSRGNTELAKWIGNDAFFYIGLPLLLLGGGFGIGSLLGGKNRRAPVSQVPKQNNPYYAEGLPQYA